MGKQFQEIAKLKIKLRVEKIGRVGLQAENQSIRDVLHAMERSLVEHENYIAELQEKNIYQNAQYVRVLDEVEGNMEAWKTQCLAR